MACRRQPRIGFALAAASACLAAVLAASPVARAQTTTQEGAASHTHHHAHHATHPHHHAAPHHPPAHHTVPKPPVVAAPAPATPQVAPAAPAPAPVPANTGRMTGLPLPRFASLRADEVNMRAGPGDRYPILWLYRRRGLPVEIEREFDVWRLVVDGDGVRGWMHQATLTGTRTFVVTATGTVSISGSERGDGTLLRDDPRLDAGVVAILRPGVVGRLRDCPAKTDWCRVTTSGYGGWLQRSAIFGLLPDEAITPP